MSQREAAFYCLDGGKDGGYPSTLLLLLTDMTVFWDENR